MSHPPADRPEMPRRLVAASPHAPPKPRPLPCYKLVLAGEPSLDLMFVVRAVMELTRFPRAEATHKMWEAHHSGRSVILITYRERAEFYAELFTARGLTVYLEPV